MYHNPEDLRGEPHAVAIRGEDDVHVTEEVYKRPLFLQPTYRYRRPVLCRTSGCGPALCCGLPLTSWRWGYVAHTCLSRGNARVGGAQSVWPA